MGWSDTLFEWGLNDFSGEIPPKPVIFAKTKPKVSSFRLMIEATDSKVAE